jgi:hypothetical protein
MHIQRDRNSRNHISTNGRTLCGLITRNRALYPYYCLAQIHCRTCRQRYIQQAPALATMLPAT